MKLLITGSQGFLGSALKRELRNRGHQVFGCDLTHSFDSQEIRADVSDYRELTAAFRLSEPDVVFHLAGEFGRHNGEIHTPKLWSTNCIGTRNVIDLCQEFKSWFVFASSSEAYGDLADNHNLSESLLTRHVPRFSNEYALTKYANEKQIEIGINRGLNATILRFFNAYGPGELYSPYRSVVCLFAYRMLHNLPITVYRNYRRVFMYIDDWASTVAGLACKCRALPNGSVFNIAGRESRTVEELADLIRRLTDSHSRIDYQSKESANVTDKRPDISKAEITLGHDPAITLEQGIPLTIEWMRQRYNIPVKAADALA